MGGAPVRTGGGPGRGWRTREDWSWREAWIGLVRGEVGSGCSGLPWGGGGATRAQAGAPARASPGTEGTRIRKAELAPYPPIAGLRRQPRASTPARAPLGTEGTRIRYQRHGSVAKDPGSWQKTTLSRTFSTRTPFEAAAGCPHSDQTSGSSIPPTGPATTRPEPRERSAALHAHPRSRHRRWRSPTQPRRPGIHHAWALVMTTREQPLTSSSRFASMRMQNR